MRLTMMSDFALRVLMFAAAHPCRLVTISEILACQDIPRGHLMKIVGTLAGAGVLRTQRGRAGGFTLGRPAAEIRIGDVLRLTEPDFEMVECFGARNACTITGNCRLPEVVNAALAAFMAVMDGHTLADIVLQPRDFQRPPSEVQGPGT